MNGLWAVLFAAAEADNPLQLVLGNLFYAFPILSLITGIICLAYRSLSNRLIVAGIGFLGHAGIFAIRLGLGRFLIVADPELIFGLLTLVNLMFEILVVVGLAMAFADIQNQFRAAGRKRPSSEDEDDRPSWRRGG
jgi:hypothetical protein